MSVSFPPRLPPRALVASLASLALLAGCSSLEGFFAGDKVDYRSQSNKTNPLEVPPDLTQLAREPRAFAPVGSGVVSASGMRPGPAGAPAASAPASTVAATAVGDARIVRDGTTRWIVTPMAPDRVIPLLRSFWQDTGFTLAVDDPQLGILETEWNENRARLPNDLIRRTLGRILDSLYSTGTIDKFRTRVERTASGGSEIVLSHRGMEEVYTDQRDQRTVWQNRPTDRELEAEMLARIMVRLGTPEAGARAQVAAAGNPPGVVAPGATPGVGLAAAQAAARPRPALTGATLTLDEGFEQAWRSVGVALDRSGYTVEDRDRSAGLYFVRWVDPRLAGREEPGFFSRLFGRGSAGADGRPERYRVVVRADGTRTLVSVQPGDNVPADRADANARQIASRLADELR